MINNTTTNNSNNNKNQREMKVYVLIQCDLDCNGKPINERVYGIYGSTDGVHCTLTKGGMYSDIVSIIGQKDNSKENIERCMVLPNMIIKRRLADYSTLPPKYDYEYFYVKMQEEE